MPISISAGGSKHMISVNIQYLAQNQPIFNFNVAFLAIIHNLLQGMLVFTLGSFLQTAEKHFKIFVMGHLLNYPLT